MTADDVVPVTLEGRFVRLVPMTAAHLDALWTAGGDPGTWAHTVSRVREIGDMERWIAAALRELAARTALPFVTVERAGGTVVGATRFGNISPKDERAEIGWTWVTPSRRGTAVNPEAKLLMLAHAFDAWRCGRVELKTAAHNAASRAAIRKLGAVEEGILRRHTRMENGEFRDTVYHSILRDEWPAVRAGLEARLRAFADPATAAT